MTRCPPNGKLWGLLSRKERWSLSLRGWLLVATTVILAVYLFLLAANRFLAVTHRVNSNILVVEGWVHEYAIRTSAEEFKNGSYEHVFTTGGPVVGSGGYINDYHTSASVGAGRLRAAGIPAECVQMVPSHVIDRDRTYSSAMALRNWFHDHNSDIRSFNVLTEDFHARRTQLLFQKAFGSAVKVGVIAVPNPDYDQRRWWRYSEGVKDVFSEGIAYIYTKFFFYPFKTEDEVKITPTL